VKRGKDFYVEIPPGETILTMFTKEQMDEAIKDAFEAGGSTGKVGVIRRNRSITDSWSFPFLSDYLKTNQ